MGGISDKNPFKPRVIVKDTFYETIDSIKKSNIKLPPFSESGDIEIDFDSLSCKIDQMESDLIHTLNIKSGMEFSKTDITIAAYDESIQRYSALEGKGVFTAHAVVIPRDNDYAAISYLTAYFYTKSDEIGKIPGITVVKDPQREMTRDKMDDEIYILKEVPENSILFIDGPLIAGDAFPKMIQQQSYFVENNIIPVFFVKNSNSNMIVNYTDLTENKYNSDMHWASSILKEGQRTSFFKYVDSFNENNTKIFCYLKFFKYSSPVRVEFFIKTFEKYRGLINQIMDLILYLLICQGNPKNAQLRPIAVAEMYAREIIKMVDVKEIMRKSGVTSTMNEDRDFKLGD